MAGQGSTSHMAPVQGAVPVRNFNFGHTSNLFRPVSKYEQASTLYHSWEKVCASCSSTSSHSSNLRKIHGPEKAAAMTRDLMQSWQQKRPEGQVPVHSAATSSTAFASTNSLQSHSQSQIPNHNVPNQGASAPPGLHYRRQEWLSDPRSAPTQSHPVAQSALAPPLRPPTDSSAPQISVTQRQEIPISNAIKEETPVHSATTTHFASTFPTAPSSQSQSILLAPEEKSSSLYTMRGLAASIKRSLNAERLAASEQATATSETPAEIRKRSPSDEAVDTTEQSELATAGANEPPISPTTDSVETMPVLPLDAGNPSSATVPSPFPQASVSQRETPDETTIPDSYQEPLPDFVPFSTLAGAVSFDNATSYSPVDHPIIPSPAASPLEGLLDSQQAGDVLPHDHMDVDVPLLSFAEASFNGLSFPTRTPTPPLSAMITPYREDDGASGKIQEAPSSDPTSPSLDQVEIQPESISPASNDPEAMVISADEDKDRIGVNVTSLSSEHSTHPEAQTLNSPNAETHAFVRRSGLLDSSIEEISGEAFENLRAEGHPGGETRKLVRTSDVPSAVHTSGSSISLKPPMKSAGKPSFYVAVPPQPEWVRKVKRQEATKKGLASEENGELFTIETPCSLLIYLGQRSERGS
jgi:hypothetical protein